MTTTTTTRACHEHRGRRPGEGRGVYCGRQKIMEANQDASAKLKVIRWIPPSITLLMSPSAPSSSTLLASSLFPRPRSPSNPTECCFKVSRPKPKHWPRSFLRCIL